MKLNCIIVDDEPGSHIVLETYLEKFGSATLLGKFFNAIDAFRFIKHNKVDIVLLDINMPEVDGFGLLDMIEHKPAVIFTTAYSDYALKGFEYGAIDYLHKPIRFERFVKAMEKAQKWCGIGQEEKNIADEIQLKVDGFTRSIKTSDIMYVESFRNYIKVNTDDKALLVLMTMNEIETKLSGKIFIRIHKSYLVNMSRVTKVVNGKVFINNYFLPIGKTYKKYFEQFIK